jgi:hypothetical protein
VDADTESDQDIQNIMRAKEFCGHFGAFRAVEDGCEMASGRVVADVLSA